MRWEIIEVFSIEVTCCHLFFKRITLAVGRPLKSLAESRQEVMMTETRVLASLNSVVGEIKARVTVVSLRDFKGPDRISVEGKWNLLAV